jgi:hypothetical protein
MTYGPYAAIGSVMPLADDIDFWSRQLSEHCLFLMLGLDDRNLKARAQRLHEEWEKFRRGARPIQAAIALTRETIAFKSEIYTKLAANQWLGWLFPLFVDHTRREAEYFLAALEGKQVDPAVECQMWMTFMGEHAAFAAHLLDPSEAENIREALRLQQKFGEHFHDCGAAVGPQLSSLGERSGQELDAYFNGLGIGKPGGAKSVIHPVLAEHVVREGRRFLQTMQMLRPTG